MGDWGGFCTYCGGALPDTAFPRQCAKGHVTYLSGLNVAVALQPVRDPRRTGLLAVKRAIAPFIGSCALPGGFVENGETVAQAAMRELHEETGITHPPGAAIRTFRQAVGTWHASGHDPRKPMLQFELLPEMTVAAIDWTFHNTETAGLAWVVYAAQTDDLRDSDGEVIELCFPLHQQAALDYLKTITAPGT